MRGTVIRGQPKNGLLNVSVKNICIAKPDWIIFFAFFKTVAKKYQVFKFLTEKKR